MQPDLKLLIVDDEEVIRELTVEIMLAHKLFPAEKIFTAENGEEGLKKLHEHSPHIVITDMIMPKMNGAKFIEHVRAVNKEVEIVIMTGFADLEMAISVVKMGVFEFLRKPFEPEELVLTVKKIFENIRLKTENEKFRLQLMEAEKLSSVGLLAAGIAHEINNPNTYIKGNLEILITKYLPFLLPLVHDAAERLGDDQQKYKNIETTLEQMLKAAFNGTERIQRIVSGLLAFSRKGDSEKQEVSLCELLDEAMLLASYRLKRHLVKLHCPSTLKTIRVNEQEIVQALLNLLVNGIDAIEERWGDGPEGILQISGSEDLTRDEQVLVFEDNGIGMDAKTRARCFEPFFTTKPIGKGTGLGMPITRGNIERNGGTIDCESKVGEGTKFTVRLPL